MKYAQREFFPKNPQKLVGNPRPFYRSSWEYIMMEALDAHPNVIHWGNESVVIPYKSPLDGKIHRYYPDFFVVFVDKYGKQRAELIEIKPAKEAILEKARSKRDKIALLVNSAKWAAAFAWAKKNGCVFRIMTEDDLFIKKGRQAKKK